MKTIRTLLHRSHAASVSAPPAIRGGTLRAGLAALALAAAAGASAAPVPLDEAMPKKAPCAVCTAFGSGHGEEKVAAASRHEDRLYFFCDPACQERFDEDPVAYLPPVFPRPAPMGRVTGPDGATVSLDAYRGQWLLLDFWATWCKPCIEAMPHVGAMARSYAPRGLTVLGVSVDEEQAKYAAFVSRKQPPYPTAFDDADPPLWERYRVTVVPTAFLIDPEGRIVAQWTGAWKPGTVEAVVDSLLPAPR